MEIWIKSPTAPDYIVSSEGRVARAAPGQGARPYTVLKQYVPPKDGRPSVTIRVDGRTKTFRVCRLVAEAFHGPPPSPRHEACHENGNPGDNRQDNLRWDTCKGNKADMVRHGTRPWGVKHGAAKLTHEQVAEIISLWERGHLKQREIGEMFGVTQVHISRLVNGKRWRPPQERVI